MRRQAVLVIALTVVACTPAPVPTSVPTTAGPVTTETTENAVTTAAPETTTTTAEPTTTTSLDPLTSLELEEVAAGYDQPVHLTSPPGDDRLFIVERRGVIRIVGVDQPFLDIDARVNSEDGIEPGLLSLAFHPDYADNGRFFVFYYQSDAERTRLAEYTVSDDPNRADPGSEAELLGFDKPTNRHNGGMILFGPDGNLWVSLGEGGAASTHSQDPNTLLSSILRISVGPEAGTYTIPADNPFVDGGGAPEVWAYGLRNPWRFSIDPVDGLVYIGDVGHERWEEIDAVPWTAGGYNFGWLRMEGTHCFQDG
ncbi:MAG: PQQ-dependent sugar dehydrogenase, partial [Acidimicrobiia bacterium]|nr:PQQ-dependent sugar dehydrogenase [Acidimicrobiia bacterium]